MAAGALAGTVYGLLYPLAKAGDFGVWLRWALSIYGYLVILTASFRHGPFSTGDPVFHLIAWIFSALGALGLVLTDDRGASRLSARQFKLLQNRVLLRAAPQWDRRVHELRAQVSQSDRLVCVAGDVVRSDLGIGGCGR